MTIENTILAKMIDLLETTPYDKIKVTKFIQYANISRSSFYFYFDSISAVLDRIENDFIAGMPDEISTISRVCTHSKNPHSYLQIIKPVWDYIGAHMRLFRILSGPNGRIEFQKKVETRIRKINEVLYHLTSSLSEQEQMIACEIAVAMQWHIYQWWANHHDMVHYDVLVSFFAKYTEKVCLA